MPRHPAHNRDIIPAPGSLRARGQAPAGVHALRPSVAQGVWLLPDMDSGLRRNDPAEIDTSGPVIALRVEKEDRPWSN